MLIFFNGCMNHLVSWQLITVNSANEGQTNRQQHMYTVCQVRTSAVFPTKPDRAAY